jgi:hypothetical protein
VHRPGHRLADQPGEPLQRQHRQRHRERDEHRERDDVARRGAAGGEELGVAPEQVEQGLRDRERPEHGDVEPSLE